MRFYLLSSSIKNCFVVFILNESEKECCQMCSFCLSVFRFEMYRINLKELKKQMRIEINLKIGGYRVETVAGNRIL